MKQVWKIDEKGFFTGESYFSANPKLNEITIPITIGYIKALWNGSSWIEGAGEDDIKQWESEQKVEEIVLSDTDIMMLAITELAEIILKGDI